VNTANAEVLRLFPTPLFVETWHEAPAANVQLRQAIMAKREQGRSVQKSNLLGWQSDVDMLEWGGGAATRLRDHVVEHCERVTHGESTTRPWQWYVEMWANISQSGASNQTHSHPGAYWSVVYYVDDGYGGSSGDRMGGELTFADPRLPMIRMRTPSLRMRFALDDEDHQEVQVRPKSGRMIIFPSWLQHAVTPYQGPHHRLSIAMNVSIFPAPVGMQA
jgi:uncharacterized protein (TIGR02466 family)